MTDNNSTDYAMIINHFGGPEEFTKVPLEAPDPGAGEIVIKTTAIGTNPLDYKMRDGSSGLCKHLSLPVILGREVAGEVVSVGEGITNLVLGDRVFGMRDSDDFRGTYATLNVFPADGVVKIPDSLDDVTAAGLALVGITATIAVDELARIQDGETVLIHGAGGGVGQVMTQLAVARGAKVLASASSRHHDKLVGFGAQHIDYTTENVFDVVRTQYPDGVDVVLDGVYFETFIPSLDILAPGGRIVELPSLADLTAAKERGIDAFIPSISNDTSIYEDLAQRIVAGEMSLPVGHTAPLSDVAEVHRLLEDGHADGKIVLTVEH